MSQEFSKPFFQSDGVLVSNVPRNRVRESAGKDYKDQLGIFNAYREFAKTQFYVVGANQMLPTPNSELRDLGKMFLSEGRVVGSINLSTDDDCATAHLVGSVTGPYAGQFGKNDEWHGMYVVNRGKKSVPTFGELKPDEMYKFNVLIAKTLDFFETREGIKGYVGFSFSPHEGKRTVKVLIDGYDEPVEIVFPRSPVQNLRIVHGHGVVIKKDYLKQMPSPFPKEVFDKRMAFEPKQEQLTEIFTELVLKPVLERYSDISIDLFTHTAEDEYFPKGTQMVVDRDQMENPRLAEFLQDLHHKAEEVYENIAGCLVDYELFLQGKVSMYPPKIIEANLDTELKKSEYKNLSASTKRFIRLLGKLKDPNTMINDTMSIAEMSSVVEQFVLLGLAYNIVFYKPEGFSNKVSIAITPRWLSGGSPTESMGIYKKQTSSEAEEFIKSCEELQDAHTRTASELIEYIGDLK